MDTCRSPPGDSSVETREPGADIHPPGARRVCGRTRCCSPRHGATSPIDVDCSAPACDYAPHTIHIARLGESPPPLRCGAMCAGQFRARIPVGHGSYVCKEYVAQLGYLFLFCFEFTGHCLMYRCSLVLLCTPHKASNSILHVYICSSQFFGSKILAHLLFAGPWHPLVGLIVCRILLG